MHSYILVHKDLTGSSRFVPISIPEEECG